MTIMADAADTEMDSLLSRVAEGDRKAFALLYDRASGKLYAVVRSILRRPELAEEALQETFVKIWQKARLYQPGAAKPFAWLSAIARNQAIDIRRRISETANASLDSDEITQAVMPVADLAVELKKLKDCLAKLPSERQDMVLLAYYQGWSREELSAQYRRPVTTVKTLLRRSLMTLKECLDGGR
ncbi:MAG: sigma-70 family RNA polymerase sigma factor [Aestuariivirga sp.]